MELRGEEHRRNGRKMWKKDQKLLKERVLREYLQLEQANQHINLASLEMQPLKKLQPLLHLQIQIEILIIYQLLYLTILPTYREALQI